MKRNLITHTGNDTRPYLLLKTNHRVARLYFEEILFLEGRDNTTTFNTLFQKVQAGYGLKQFETLLPENFMRVHQSFIINRCFFDYYESDNGYIYLKAGTETKIPLGCTHEEAFFDWLNTL